MRRAAGVTQDILEVDHICQSGDGEEPSLSVGKTVRDKSKKNDIMEEENMTREWYKNTLCKNFKSLNYFLMSVDTVSLYEK